MKFIVTLLVSLLSMSVFGQAIDYRSLIGTYFSTNGYYVRGMFGTNAADGSLTNRNNANGVASVSGTNAVLMLDTRTSGNPLFVGRLHGTNLITINSSGINYTADGENGAAATPHLTWYSRDSSAFNYYGLVDIFCPRGSSSSYGGIELDGQNADGQEVTTDIHAGPGEFLWRTYGFPGATNVFTIARDGNLEYIRGNKLSWPFTNGTSGQALVTDGATPQQLSWAAFAGAGIGTNVVTTNSNTGFTNIIKSISGSGVGPGTVNQVAMFTSTTNVGDSILAQVSTNMIQTRSRIASIAYTNTVTNILLSEFTSANNWLGLEIESVSSDNSARISQRRGSGSTAILTGLILNDAWGINGVGTVAAGGHNGDLLPVADNAITVGNSSSRVKSMFTGAGGYAATDATTDKTANFGGGTYGAAMGANGIALVYNSGPNFIFGAQRDANGLYGVSINNGVMGAGPNTLNGYGWDTFITRGNNANEWSFTTNNASATTPTSATLYGSMATGANHPGGNLVVAGGQGTGTGRGGDFAIATARPGSSSSSQNSFTTNFFIAANPVTLVESTATIVANVALASSKVLGMVVTASVEANDGTDYQIDTQSFAVDVVNKAASLTINTSVSVPSSSALSSGTLAVTWSAVANGASVDLKANAVSSLTQTVLRVIGYQIVIHTTGTSVITAN